MLLFICWLKFVKTFLFSFCYIIAVVISADEKDKKTYSIKLQDTLHQTAHFQVRKVLNLAWFRNYSLHKICLGHFFRVENRLFALRALEIVLNGLFTLSVGLWQMVYRKVQFLGQFYLTYMLIIFVWTLTVVWCRSMPMIVVEMGTTLLWF